ncbi:heavy metal translocating P-type ATPase [Dongia sedimenti]|uniref:Heavy metal translocating P-type ATPase metal-binding domain-containing protein n=1 Tax=Dongia sedimenti TaxID=3064282 RepID=A0ABU0YJA2_9PROT|nr:heavy metal translocating P-type ATPase metal-binding domain-containing protein [Rhodospirillaceae bacterium R-7]
MNAIPQFAAADRACPIAGDRLCKHCGTPFRGEGAFCCHGCAGAYELVQSLGLSRYYEQRVADPAQPPTRPDDILTELDLSAWTRDVGSGEKELSLMVEGLQCGACIWLIEQTLLKQPGVTAARVALSTRRLTLRWNDAETDPEGLVQLVNRLGYRLVPCDPERLASEADKESKALMTAMAVAGFAAGNIMLMSVSVWSGADPGTRDLLHWISALIAIPAIAYAGRPFFNSALAALKAGRTNMDVPISLAIILAPSISLFETFRSGEHAYFDSAVTLLFFLLIGRYLDRRARGRAHATAARLLALNAVAATVVEPDGRQHSLLPSQLRPGMTVLIAPGSRAPADGTIKTGSSDLDLSAITGESAPQRCSPGDRLFAGTLNLTGPLKMLVNAVGDSTLLADMVRLMEAAESRKGRFVRIADRVARRYAPVVHVVALATFLGWWFLGNLAWTEALMIAVAVLIITCPCALALAVPVVQVVASQRLMRSGILLKSADALERLTDVDTVVFDKTGTLTLGRLDLQPGADPELLKIAAGIAANSRHPLARALSRAAPDATVLTDAKEHPGAGLEWEGWKLGSCAYTGQAEDAATDQVLWLVGPASPHQEGRKQRFQFSDRLRPDAEAVVAQLKSLGLQLQILSGDRAAPVEDLARQLGIDVFAAKLSPIDKASRLETLAKAGHKVLMVGDGINDAAALAGAHVSMAPASGTEITQSAADVVFQGDRLEAIPLTLDLAKRTDRLVRQNLGLALLYNLAAVPLAILGFVTPLIAAIAMSSSSIIVILNALRLGKARLS